MTLLRTTGVLNLFLLVGILIISICQDVVGRAAGFLQTRINKSPNQQVKRTKPETPDQPGASSLPSTMDRTPLPLPKALLGHWVIEKSGTHYYFSESKAISVYSGRVHHIPYKIEEVNEEERRIRVRITSVHARILTFSPDKREISDVGDYTTFKSEEAFIWKYVDNGSRPSPEILDKSSTGEPTIEVTSAQENPKFIIGDLRKKIYYSSDCTDFENLPLEKRVYFTTKRDARQAGYKAAKNCP